MESENKSGDSGSFYSRYDWKITFPDWKQKILKIFFEKNLRKRRIVPKNEKGGTLWDS